MLKADMKFPQGGKRSIRNNTGNLGHARTGNQK